MRLITFKHNYEQHIGAMLPDDLSFVDFTASDSALEFSSMNSLIDGGARALDRARVLIERSQEIYSLNDVQLLSPLPLPRQMRDFLCFEKHLRQARAHRYLFGLEAERDPAKISLPKIWYDEPIYYKCNRFSFVGPGVDVTIPRYSKMMDFELEFAAVLGRGGKNIAKKDAMGHIFGYCIFNDFSARDQQMREIQGSLGPTKGKDFDTGNVLGPWLVTADEVGDPYSLKMVARVNGQTWAEGTSASMHHRFEDIIAHVSTDETLVAGEILGSGTVGDGCGLEHGRFLAPGDVVELEVSKLGVLRNRVVAGEQAG